MSESELQKPCVCGRSPTGFCNGFHNMTNERYQRYVADKEALLKSLNEQAKPQFLVD